MPDDLPRPKRGAIPSPRSALAAASPHIPVPAPPPNFVTIPKRISFWGNNVHADCATAEEAFAKACTGVRGEFFISDEEVIAWATANGVLENADISHVLRLMRESGFSQDGCLYSDGPFFSVDWTNDALVRSAVSTGPVKLGVAADQLEPIFMAAQGQSGWFGTGFHADPVEDHCISICGYGTMAWLAGQLGVKVPAGVDGAAQGYAVFTWNSIGILDVPSMVAITHEAWVRQPTTILVPVGAGPAQVCS